MPERPTTRLKALGLTLPEPATPAFNYVPAIVHNGLVFVSGQLPKEDGVVRKTGRVGADLTLEEAQEAARIATLQGLACASAAVGGLDRLRRVLRVAGYVVVAPGFTGQPQVIDAASDLLTRIFGAEGRHTRMAVGIAELPRNAPLEIEFLFATE